MLDPHRILVIDDDPVVLRVMTTILSAEFAVESALDPEVALGLLSRKRFDCVVTDWLLGAKDGSAVLGAVASIRADLRPTVIVLTGGDAITIGSEAHQLGALRVIKKPISAPIALACVREALARHDRGAAFTTGASESETVARKTTRLPDPSNYGRRSKSVARTRMQDKPHVLLVEESDTTCAILSSVLSQRFVVRIANTMGAAQRIAAEQRFDAIVTDWTIGLTDASRLVADIRARCGTQSPVIVQTWDKSGRTRDAAEEAGAWITLCKPVSVSELEKQIRVSLEARSNPAPARS